MRVLAITAAKGGVGKSTLAVHMAALAETMGVKTVVIDLDDQSARHWGEARQNPRPIVVNPPAALLGDVLNAAREEGAGLCIIDTPPKAAADIVPAAKAADFTLVPTRPGPFDLRAVQRTLDMLEATGSRYAVVLNHAPPNARALLDEARAFLAPAPIAPVVLAARVAFSHALITGGSVTEFEPNGRAAAEMLQLWEFVKQELWHGEAPRAGGLQGRRKRA